MKPDSCIMIIRNLIALATVVVALTNLNGCSDPTKPKDVKYNLYVGATHLASSEEDSSFNRIYIYDADSLTLLDSIWQAHFTENLAASPDGRWLYVLDFTTQSVPRMLWKLDVRTKRVLWSRSDFGGGGGRARIHLLQDGAILLVGNTIVTPEDGTAVRTFTDSLFTMWGPVSGTKVAVIVRGQPLWHGNDSLLRVLDAATGELSGGYVAHLSTGEVLRDIYTARLHPDGRRVLAIGVHGSVYNSWFVVGDVETGQTLFEYRINYPHGEITITGDGTLAAFTDPGTPSFGEVGTAYVINLRTYQVTAPAPPGEIPASQIRFLPGDRRIVTAPAALPAIDDAGPLRVMDVATMTLESTIWPIPSDSLTGEIIGHLAIGPRP